VIVVAWLPSPYDIADLGFAAFSWIDRFHSAGQHWWQVLPLGPTGVRKFFLSVNVVVRGQSNDNPYIVWPSSNALGASL
jgi:4-alpha-glucanotransferase